MSDNSVEAPTTDTTDVLDPTYTPDAFRLHAGDVVGESGQVPIGTGESLFVAVAHKCGHVQTRALRTYDYRSKYWRPLKQLAPSPPQSLVELQQKLLARAVNSQTLYWSKRLCKDCWLRDFGGAIDAD